MARPSRIELIRKELQSHLPFTLFGTVTGIALMGIIYTVFVRLGKIDQLFVFHNAFHTFHFAHIFLSAMATSTLFYRHSPNLKMVFLVGYLSTLTFCAMSDALIPFLGGIILGVEMHFHLCLADEPLLVLASNTAGILAALMLKNRLGKASFFSHGGHVLVSSFASVFYLVTFGFEFNVSSLFAVFLISAFSVVIPCCSSDIIMPLSFIGGIHGHEHDDEHTH